MSGQSARVRGYPSRTVGETESARRYQIMEPLGQGGQGSTFRGVDRDTGASVAIKVFTLKGAKSWKAFDRFEREMDTLAKLSHPGIPKYIDRYAYEASGDYFLVMDLVEGVPLSKHVEEPGLPTKKVRAVLDQSLDVLAYLHGQRPALIHRDIKPANVLLRPDGTIALVDFGGVRQRAGTTEATTTVGTFGYMAPEQLHGEATPASDVYALGATVLALLTRKNPEDLPHRGLRFDFTALKLPAPFDRLLPMMLEPDPEERLPDVKSVRAVLLTKPRPKAPPQPPKAPQTPAPPTSSALVHIPEGARVLANTPAPFSVVVWILSALGAGILLVFEAVFLPFFFQLATALRNKPAHDPQARAFKEDYERFRASVGQAREAVSHVAEHTRPRT